MVVVPSYVDQVITVQGLACTGKAAIYSLLKGGALVIAWDDNAECMEGVMRDYQSTQEYAAFLASGKLKFRPPHEREWGLIKALVLSPGIPTSYPAPNASVLAARKHGVPIMCDIELLQMAAPNASYIGMTGTNGKSTTTALIGHIFRSLRKTAEVGGNIGQPALSLASLDQGDFYVIESSSFQLGLLHNMRFDIAVMLSVTPDHLDRHGTFQNYVEAKCKIFAGQSINDYAIVSVNANDDILERLLARRAQKIIPIASNKELSKGISVIDDRIIDNYFSQQVYDMGTIPDLLGVHNAENIAAAFATSLASGLEASEVIKSIKSFVALPHRMAPVLRAGELWFINDSKATNASSSYWALKTYDEIYWIAGGISKDGGIEPLKEFFPKIKHAYLVGASSLVFSEVLVRYDVPHTISHTLDMALKQIRDSNIRRGNVLLSPACSSLDQWKNFEERGEAFISLAKKYFAFAAK